jgi:hypothetical protein
VNVSRQKTKKWANFKPQNYDGDDWGDEYDDDPDEQDEPEPPVPPKPMGPRHPAADNSSLPDRRLYGHFRSSIRARPRRDQGSPR